DKPFKKSQTAEAPSAWRRTNGPVQARRRRAKLGVELTTAGPAEARRLRQRAQLILDLLTPEGKPTIPSRASSGPPARIAFSRTGAVLAGGVRVRRPELLTSLPRPVPQPPDRDRDLTNSVGANRDRL